MQGIEAAGTGTDVDEPVGANGRGGDHPGVALEFPLGRSRRNLDLEDHHSLGRPLFVHIG